MLGNDIQGVVIRGTCTMTSTEAHRKELLDNLYSLYKLNILTDVTLVINDVNFSCHRNVLVASSPYFRAMFTNQLAEQNADCIHIHEVAADVMKHVIEFLYTGNTHVTNENAQDLMTAAAMFDLPNLIGLCTDHVIKEICLSNCVELLMFSSHFGCQRLKDSVNHFILDHFIDVFQTNGSKFVDLDIEHLDDILADDDLCIEKEELLFDILVKWVSVNDIRSCYFPKLFKHIRLALIPDSFINSVIRQHTLVRNDPLCQQILRKYDRYKTERGCEHSSQLFDINTTPRHGMFNRVMVVFSGGSRTKSDRALTAFDPLTFKNYIGVHPHDTFDLDRKIDLYQLATTSNNKLFFLGGVYYEEYKSTDTASAFSDVLQYNIKSVQWETVSSMNTPRCCFAVVAIDTKLYVIGGKPQYPRGQPTVSVEVYDTEEDWWAELSPLPISIYGHSAAVTSQHDTIYVIGGKDADDDVLDTVFRYNVSRDSWTLVTTQMPKPRAFCTSFCHKDLIYVVGGTVLRDTIQSVAIYNPLNNTWTSGAEFPEQRKITTAGFHNGIIFVCGGIRHLGVSGRRSREVESRDLYKYDIDQNTWSKVVKLVQYGNKESMTMAVLNTKYLSESDFISTC